MVQRKRSSQAWDFQLADALVEEGVKLVTASSFVVDLLCFAGSATNLSASKSTVLSLAVQSKCFLP